VTLAQTKQEQIIRKAELADGAANIALSLGKVAMEFARVRRVPRYGDGERESDVEHSYMLALIAPELAVALELDLDPTLVGEFAKVHDLIELKTGDINTFAATKEQLMQKELNEKRALHNLVDELPPYTANLLVRYEEQREPEARFVKAVDKILPFVVDIIGKHGKHIMREDNGVTTREEFDRCLHELQESLNERFGEEFEEIVLAHKILGELFASQFK
jgi:putative hydrolase of HD superfamily